MKETFVPIDYSYFDFEGKNIICLIGRNNKGKRICVLDSYEPNFYVILNDGTKNNEIEKIREKIEKIEISNNSRTSNVTKTTIERKNYLGKEVIAIRIFVSNHKDMHDFADQIDFKEVFKRREYDLPIISKYIIEKKIEPFQWLEVEGELLRDSLEFGKFDSALDFNLCIKAEKISKSNYPEELSPNFLAYDIETDNIELGKGEILSISLYGKNFKKVLTHKKCESKQEFVEILSSEEKMLNAFVKEVKEYDPDFLVGYFSDGFDLPYLKARAEKNKMKLPLGLNGSQPTFARGILTSGKIFGIVHIDLFRFIKSVYSQYMQSETLSLDDVCHELIGERKMEFDFSKLSKLKDGDWKDLFEYNLHDSVITYKLAEKIWPDIFEFTKIMREPVFDVSRNSMSANVEDYIIHNLEKFNEIAEKKPMGEEVSKRREREKYEGAFVFKPSPGLYENIVFFDFTSYWPSIIVSYNLSRSTYLEKEENNSLEVDIGDKKLYFSKKPGFFPKILNEIIDKRKQYKQEYNKDKSPITKARSNAYKLLANASYGYQGFFGARYYCPEASAATTAISRDFIKKIIDKINTKGCQVIYSDTDSIAFLRNKNTKKETLDLLKELNDDLPGIMELDLEDFYNRGLFVSKRTTQEGAKKKYALINEEGKFKIRGFETVRRDWCELARELQNEVLEKVLTEGNEKSALELLKKTVEKLKNRKIEKNKLTIRTQLKKSIDEYIAQGPHVIAAKKMKDANLPVSSGMLIEYFIAETNKKKPLIREMVALPDEKKEYNIEYYLKNQLLPAVENIFEVFNIDVNEIIDGHKQKTLF